MQNGSQQDRKNRYRIPNFWHGSACRWKQHSRVAQRKWLSLRFRLQPRLLELASPPRTCTPYQIILSFRHRSWYVLWSGSVFHSCCKERMHSVREWSEPFLFLLFEPKRGEKPRTTSECFAVIARWQRESPRSISMQPISLGCFSPQTFASLRLSWICLLLQSSFAPPCRIASSYSKPSMC